MSESYYNELWLITREDLEKLLELDQKIQETPARRKEEALNLTVPTYLKYRNLVKRLIVCHDQMVQSQKRDLIKRVLDSAIGRMLEYKREIVNWDYSDYLWPDDFMNQLKFTPDDVNIYVSATGKDVVRQRRKMLEEMIENARNQPPPKSEEIPEEESETGEQDGESALKFRLPRKKKKVSDEAELIPEESPEVVAAREAQIAAEEAMRNAMILIQSHERARRARCIGLDVQRLYEYNRKLAMGVMSPKKIDKAKFNNAIVTIQRAWRRYAAKLALKKRKAQTEEILGITIPSWRSREVFEKDEENFSKKLDLMPKSVAEVEQAITDERGKLLKIRGPGLIEDITEEIREWFFVWYNELGHFDIIPAANLGGSILIVTGQTLTPQEYLVEKKKKETEKGGKEKAGAETGRKTKEKEKKKFVGWKMPQTEAFSLLETANKDFIEDWTFPGKTNQSQKNEVYMELIKNKLCYELQLEMREIVDELMRLELEKMNKALLKDHAQDKEKFDIPRAKKGKKKGKKGKKKRKKDALDNIPIEDLFNELACANIIRHYPMTSLKDWIGDYSYQNYEARREFRDHKHRIGEIQDVVMEYCVLPLSSKEVHRIAPLTRSVCICGLQRCGKSFLVNAICSEVGALLFDMTPHVLVDKYVGKKDEKKLINMISKVARAYAPSIIFIDNGEKPWLKKVPPEEQYYQPKRFARHYPKLVKGIKRGDQILFLTTSSEPYKASRPFVRIHDKFIMIPLTDYNTLYMFYKDLLMKYHGVDRNIDVSCLAKTSLGIPLEFIKQSVEKVLNVRRRVTLKFQPLDPLEIMKEVMMYEAPKQKTLNQLEKFERKTPLGKKRARMLAAEKEAAKQLAAQKQQTKKKR